MKAINKPKRRANKSGSISINRQANKYMVVWKDETGKRRTRSTFAISNEGKQQAEAFLNDILQRKEAGITTAKTASLYQCIEEYIKASENVLRSSTINIRAMSERLLLRTLPELCQQPIGNITTQDIQRSFQQLQDKGISASSILRIKILLNLVFNRCLLFGLIIRNPCIGIRPPRIKKKEIEILNWRQIGKIFRFIRKQKKHNRISHDYHLIFRLLHNSGIRVGELLALRWKDIDLTNRIIHIHSTVSGKNGQFIEEPKTASGNRFIPIFSDKTYKLLKEAKKSNESFFCSSPQCERMIYNNLLREWSLIRKYTGIKASLHAWRHTAASLWLSEKHFPIATVSKLLGHANPQITLEIYAHSLPNSDEALIKLYNAKK